MGVLKEISELCIDELGHHAKNTTDLVEEIVALADELDDTYLELKQEFMKEVGRLCEENNLCAECYRELKTRQVKEPHDELDGKPYEYFYETYCDCEE